VLLIMRSHDAFLL